MAQLKKEDVEKGLDSRRTVQRLVSVTDQSRFDASVKNECDRRLQLLMRRLTESVDRLVSAVGAEGTIESRNPPANQIQPIMAELDTELATQQAAGASYNDALAQRNVARQAIENFKFKHDRLEPPEVADSQLLHVGTLLALLFGETVINSVSFGEVSASGLLGGFGQAFLFTVVNLAIATFGAWCFKYKNHFDSNLRIFGWSSLGVFGAAGFFYNCFVGHYRQALGSDDFEEAIRNSAASFYEHFGLGITDGGALLLVILGLIIFCFAFVKIYGFEDPYPGYAKVGRKQQEASAALSQLREETRLPKLKEAYDTAVQGLSLLSVEYSEHVQACSVSLESKKMMSYEVAGLTPRFRVVLGELIDDFLHLLHSSPVKCQIPEIDVSRYQERLNPLNPVTDFDFSEEEQALEAMQGRKAEFDLRVNEEISNLNADLNKDIEELRSGWAAEDLAVNEVA